MIEVTVAFPSTVKTRCPSPRLIIQYLEIIQQLCKVSGMKQCDVDTKLLGATSPL